jgi:hypothetical protein
MGTNPHEKKTEPNCWALSLCGFWGLFGLKEKIALFRLVERPGIPRPTEAGSGGLRIKEQECGWLGDPWDLAQVRERRWFRAPNRRLSFV